MEEQTAPSRRKCGEHDPRFILFGGEEGLFGSKRYVADLLAEERARIRAVVNMDMIGTLNAPTWNVLLESAPLSQGVIDGLSEAATSYTQLGVETSLHPYARDHVPFSALRSPPCSLSKEPTAPTATFIPERTQSTTSITTSPWRFCA